MSGGRRPLQLSSHTFFIVRKSHNIYSIPAIGSAMWYDAGGVAYARSRPMIDRTEGRIENADAEISALSQLWPSSVLRKADLL